MVNRHLLPLGLLYADGSREVRGITRLQKLVFLTQEETEIDELFDFKPHKYGPYSPELQESLHQLEQEDLVRRNREKTRGGNESYVFSITNKGIQVIRQALNSGDEIESAEADEVMSNAQHIKKEFNNIPLERLLRIVYNKYPELTEKSEIKGDLGL